MKKTIVGFSILILAASAFAGEPRINTTRDSGGYEATLRVAGVPLSGGMAWTGHSGAPSDVAVAAAPASAPRVLYGKVSVKKAHAAT
ncbi:MAG TPA: hypothetical protein VI279_00020 [Rhodocyclaceae bacterium]